MECILHRPMPLRHNFHSMSRWGLTRKARNLPFEDLSFANFADSKVNATKLEILNSKVDQLKNQLKYFQSSFLVKVMDSLYNANALLQNKISRLNAVVEFSKKYTKIPDSTYNSLIKQIMGN